MVGLNLRLLKKAINTLIVRFERKCKLIRLFKPIILKQFKLKRGHFFIVLIQF